MLRRAQCKVDLYKKCCWTGRDGLERASTLFIWLPYVKGAVVGELLGFLLLCHRLLQLAPRGDRGQYPDMWGQYSELDRRGSTPTPGERGFRVRLDSLHSVNYLNGHAAVGADYLVRVCRSAMGEVMDADAVPLTVIFIPRNTDRMHKLCDHWALRERYTRP